MEEEIIINQMESEKNEPEDGDEKANPIEGLVIKKDGPKIVSRYLRSSKGSCHDFCKYGIKHVVEAKPWITAKKTVITRESKTKVPKETAVTSPAGRKKSRSSSKTTSENGEVNCPVDIKEVTPSLTNEGTVTSEKNFPPFEATNVPMEHTNFPTFEETNVSMEHTKNDTRQASLEPSSPTVQECSNAQEIVKSKSRPGSIGIKKTKSTGSKQTRTSPIGGKEKSSMPPSVPLPSKHNVKKPSSLSAKTAKKLNHKNVEEVKKPELASNDNFPDKVLHAIEPTSANSSVEATMACGETTKLSSASASTSASGDKSLKQTSTQIGKSKQTSKQIGKSVLAAASSRKGLRHGGHGIHPTISVAPSHLPTGNKGKRLMPLKKQSSSPSPSASPISSSSSSLGKQNGGTTTSKYIKTGHRQGENVKVGYKIKQKRSTIVGAANKVIPARKLTFKRGKVIEVQPQNSNILPRRLKFRPARRLGDDFMRDRKRIIGRKEVDNGVSNDAIASIKSGKKVGDGSKIDGSKLRSEKVVLKRQNVEGKKVNPRLYNNVIEETASMLAELRQSKVKALVGAFETVISLDSPRGEATRSEISTAC